MRKFFKWCCVLVVAVGVSTGFIPVSAQNLVPDSINGKQLNEIVVTASNQTTSAAVTSYLPTLRQKNASQTGIDLLNRMAIPQLSMGTGNSITTVANQPVAIFINGLPATPSDITNMRTADVVKVEYYDYPSDSRFQGNAHVVNFIVKEYEYGGYVKGVGTEAFIANDGQLNLFGKLQTRKLTFDLGLGGAYSRSAHSFTEMSEIYRRPTEKGTTEIARNEEVVKADYLNKLMWPSFRLIYRTDNVTISNTIGAALDHTPTNDAVGRIKYLSNGLSTDSPATDFSRTASQSENSLSYSGSWNFVFGKNSSISFTPVYSYSHSTQRNGYVENSADIANMAADDSHSGRARLQLSQRLGNYSSVNLYCQGLFYRSATRYTGTTNITDNLLTYRIGPGAGYSYTRGNYYIYTGIGLNYDKSKYGTVIENSTQPWADGSLQYSFNNKNRASAEFHYMTSVPSASYRSEAIIQVNPLMSYTGNPALKPYKSLDYGVTYTYLPNNRFSFTAFATAWSVWERYAFAYQPIDNGILRKIEQPLGTFTSLTAGVRGRANLLQNRLMLSGQMAVPYCYNGAPYNWNKAGVNYSLQAYYYLGAWNFGAQYYSEWSTPGNAVNGLWTKSRPIYLGGIGWGNADWNVQVQIANPFSWKWLNSTSTMNSAYYSYTQTAFGTGSHCYIKLNVAYTFGFGKQVKRTDEATRQQGAGSAILQ